MATDSDSDGNLEVTNPNEFQTASVPPDTNFLPTFNTTDGEPNSLEQIGAFLQRARSGLALQDGSNVGAGFLASVNGASILEDEIILGQWKAPNQVASENSDLINLGLLLGISQKELAPISITAADEDDVAVLLTKQPFRNRYVYGYNSTDKVLNIDITIDKDEASADDGTTASLHTVFASTLFRVKLFRHNRLTPTTRGAIQSWVIAGMHTNMLPPIEEPTLEAGAFGGTATLSIIQGATDHTIPLVLRISIPANSAFRHFGMVSFEHL